MGKRRKVKPTKAARNWFAVFAHNRKGGPHLDEKKEASKQACRAEGTEAELDQTSGYFEAIRRSRSRGVQLIRNAWCIKCGTVEQYLLKVGSVPFCQECFEQTFRTDDPPRKEVEQYQHWLHRYFEEIGEESSVGPGRE